MGVDSNLKGVPDFSNIELVQTGTMEIPLQSVTAGDEAGTSVAHNLGFVPLAFVYLFNEGTEFYYPIPNILAWGTSGGSHQIQTMAFMAVSANSLTVSVTVSTTANYGPYSFKYYLLRQTAQPT